MRFVHTPVVVFSDANTMLNAECLKKMMVHYQDAKVGGVAGEKKILRNNYESVVGEAEGMYWQYESFLKKMDAEFNTIVGAAGELFSIRTGLFREMNDDVILDDFVISMQVCLQGCKVQYEPDAFATESPSASLSEEEKRKTRISAGAYQSVGLLKECLNIFKHPLLSFQFISRRLLRWVFCPLALILLLVSNILLVLEYNNNLFSSILLAQTVCYAFALFGWIFVRSGKRAGLFTIPFYFVFMNFCLVKGFFRFAAGKQTVLWEKSLRQVAE
jgi:cellulose synthase/poly-beta-1,6-N-acetylglucosamine synthase-like glycosyltransferase